MKESILLTEMNRNYTGQFNRLEVLPFSNDVHNNSGVYLQEVEGCGYRVYEMTPEQAIELGMILIRQANKSLRDFNQKFAEKTVVFTH